MARAHLNPYDAAAAVLIVATAFVRVWLIALGLPRFDSDEGTMGLMALHIGYHGEHPIFFYGQAYMGALQAYLAGVAFHVLGVSDLTLRLGLVLLTVLFLTAMYLLIRLLYSGPFALLSARPSRSLRLSRRFATGRGARPHRETPSRQLAALGHGGLHRLPEASDRGEEWVSSEVRSRSSEVDRLD